MSDLKISTELAQEIKTTQEMLGKFITRPVLQEKILSKPPFRFIHDVVINVIETTGFMKGVFTDEELNPKTVFSTDERRMFLNKLIITAMEATGESTDVRPSRILSGKDPENTNILLQIIARGIRLEKEAGKTKPKGKILAEKPEKKNKLQASAAPSSKTHLEQREKIIPDPISRNNKSSTSSTTIANNTRAKTKPGSRSRINSSQKLEGQIPLGNATGKNHPDPVDLKESVGKKTNTGKESGKSNVPKKAKSKATLHSKGTKLVDPSPGTTEKKAGKHNKDDHKHEEMNEHDDGVDMRLAGSAKHLPSIVTSKKSKTEVLPLRPSSRLSGIEKSKCNSSSGASSTEKLNVAEPQDKIESTRARTKGKKKTSKATIIHEYPQQDRPITRAGFPLREDTVITMDQDYPNPAMWVEEEDEIEVIQYLATTSKILDSDVNVGISGDDESCHNLYNELCNPKATTLTEAEISENEECQNIALAQMGSEVSICKSDSYTSIMITDEEFYRDSKEDAVYMYAMPKAMDLPPLNVTVPEDRVEEEESVCEEICDERPDAAQLEVIQDGLAMSIPESCPTTLPLTIIRPDPLQSRPSTARPSTARPSTARPPPPSRSGLNRADDSYKPPEGRVPSIILDCNADDMEDEVFVTKVAKVPDAGADPKLKFADTLANLILGGNSEEGRLPAPELRGYLVDQIITTQQDLEVKEVQSLLGLIDLDKPKQMSRDNYAEEIEKLKNLIQLAAKNANPVAKLLDYVGEDVHFIEADLYRYREESKHLNKEIEQAQQDAKKFLEPLEKELANTEIKIQQKEMEIGGTKMNIRKLEDRIANILSGLDRVVPSNPRFIRDMLPSAEEVMRMVNSSTSIQGLYTSSGDWKRNSLIGIDLGERRTNDSTENGRESGDTGDYALPQHQLTNWSL